MWVYVGGGGGGRGQRRRRIKGGGGGIDAFWVIKVSMLANTVHTVQCMFTVTEEHVQYVLQWCTYGNIK